MQEYYVNEGIYFGSVAPLSNQVGGGKLNLQSNFETDLSGNDAKGACVGSDSR